MYSLVQLVTLSTLKAGPVDMPLYWLGEIVEGFQKAPFVSAGRFQGQHGMLEGGWWIFMNVLDTSLFCFLCVVSCMVAVYPDKELEADSPLQPQKNAHATLVGLGITIRGFMLAGAGYWWYVQGLQEDLD